jgi:hypothetical protein
MKTWLRSILILALAGLCFSGYLSAVKLFSGACAFNESCPYFLGYPACWYGFAMYLGMFITSVLAVFSKISAISTFKINIAISALGIVFAGSFAWQELLGSKIIAGALGLSTCAYGLIFYAAIFILSVIALGKSKQALP